MFVSFPPSLCLFTLFNPACISHDAVNTISHDAGKSGAHLYTPPLCLSFASFCGAAHSVVSPLPIPGAPWPNTPGPVGMEPAATVNPGSKRAQTHATQH